MNGGHLSQQSGKTEKKKPSAVARGNKQTRRQYERPQKGGGRSQAYKKGFILSLDADHYEGAVVATFSEQDAGPFSDGL